MGPGLLREQRLQVLHDTEEEPTQFLQVAEGFPRGRRWRRARRAGTAKLAGQRRERRERRSPQSLRALVALPRSRVGRGVLRARRRVLPARRRVLPARRRVLPARRRVLPARRTLAQGLREQRLHAPEPLPVVADHGAHHAGAILRRHLRYVFLVLRRRQQRHDAALVRVRQLDEVPQPREAFDGPVERPEGRGLLPHSVDERAIVEGPQHGAH